jgi:hypothetical protein
LAQQPVVVATALDKIVLMAQEVLVAQLDQTVVVALVEVVVGQLHWDFI